VVARFGFLLNENRKFLHVLQRKNLENTTYQLVISLNILVLAMSLKDKTKIGRIKRKKNVHPETGYFIRKSLRLFLFSSWKHTWFCSVSVLINHMHGLISRFKWLP